ncbi:hypothetical protein UAW_03220 [Enterococcus haemoperoxidus ATCC BAA-382]|uniref:Uncharacterized protein n=1 Tax=Enterococcus haemoperoxidus ATCC BAA-382 TaxID=1158608 RepID=R2S9L4_9ENTE|nr:hypothetical protein [Enterococcus haemoperoxidus]EOH92235.1 hypothetical protein UAW_03220 [Enterococcus haemoperoxidus ATCC BAA-382]EOT61920.1 hypothetical protein I583_00903 [Enterococcus haemoperoxidus ATCC BAA-382]OJG54172.1 hypothetical protein RV06_GL003125 [Enterococcus haemoperoxidus]
MFPVGGYERFLNKIKGRDADEKKTHVFGVLFADMDQLDARSYILNYLDFFNENSNIYIDFYIPGYTNKDLNYYTEIPNTIKINGKTFFFSRDLYNTFIKKFRLDFDVNIPYTPSLFLMEYKNGNFNKAKFIEIDLDEGSNSVRRAGELFDRIFEIAKDGSDVRIINNMLELNSLVDYFKTDFVNDLGIPLLTVGKKITERITKFRLN